MIKEWISKLTDQYFKNENTGIGKLFFIVDTEIEQLKTTFKTTEEWRSLNNAQGTTLDLMGENINQPRGRASDDVYRIMIRGKEALNQSDGTFDSILRVLSAAVDCDPSEINMYSLKERGENEPAALIITKAPIDALNRVGMSPSQFVQLAQRSTLAGVRVDSANFQGTFSFGPVPMEKNSEKGFSDVEGTTGGYLGAVSVPGDDSELPI